MVSKTIDLNGYAIRKEGTAGGTVTPGHLVTFDSSADYVVHPTAGGNASAQFAHENDIAGDGIDVDYLATNQIQVVVFKIGGEVNALLAANAEAIVAGDFLESAGDGTLRLHGAPQADSNGSLGEGETLQLKAIVAQAMEDQDNSGGSGTLRIRVQVV